MKRLGYHATWQTTCFINGGCGADVYAHTNGDGGFVLFDDLNHPWPIHDCYENRHINDHEGQHLDIDYDNVPDNSRGVIAYIVPRPAGPKHYDVVGTVTDVLPGAIGKSETFRALNQSTQDDTRKMLSGRTSLMSVVSGELKRFDALFDSKKYKVGKKDIVAIRIKAKDILNSRMFMVTEIKHFKGGQPG